MQGEDLALSPNRLSWAASRVEPAQRGMEHLAEGGAHLLLVTGEPGIGKTRLAQELGRRVRAEGHVVAWLVRTRLRADCPGVPWSISSDRRLSEATSTRSTRSGGPSSLVSARTPRRFPAIWTEPAGDLAQRQRLFDAVSRAIVVADRPRLLIIDDLQWCDAETIELIGFVVRSARTAPVLFIGTVRSEELPEHHPLRRLVDALGHDRAVTTVPLDPLDEATTARLAARTRPSDTIDPELAARLWWETEGNPLCDRSSSSRDLP